MQASTDQKGLPSKEVAPKTEAFLKEFNTLTYITNQLPQKAQKGLHIVDVHATCVDATKEYVAVGTNIGLIFMYDRYRQAMQKLSCQAKGEEITRVRLKLSVDFVVAASTVAGGVYIFQLPSPLPGRNKQLKMFSVRDTHESPVTCLEWSQNAMKLFSADVTGKVVCTELDYAESNSATYTVCQENHEVVQLNYAHKTLLVSTKFRTAVCRTDLSNQTMQVGQKDRKSLGDYGASFLPSMCRPADAVLFATRPGWRMWKASIEGVVKATYIFKDLINETTRGFKLFPDTLCNIPLKGQDDRQFGPVLFYKEKFIITWGSGLLYVLDPNKGQVVAWESSMGDLIDVSVHDDEVFILREGHARQLIRLAQTPDPFAPEESMVVASSPSSDGSASPAPRSQRPTASATTSTVQMSPVHILTETANKVSQELLGKLKEVVKVDEPGRGVVPPWGAAPGTEQDSRSMVDSTTSVGSGGSNAMMNAETGARDMASSDTAYKPKIKLLTDDILSVEISEPASTGNESESIPAIVGEGSAAGGSSAEGRKAVGRSGLQDMPLDHRRDKLDQIGQEQFDDILFERKPKKHKKKKHKTAKEQEDSSSVASLDLLEGGEGAVDPRVESSPTVSHSQPSTSPGGAGITDPDISSQDLLQPSVEEVKDKVSESSEKVEIVRDEKPPNVELIHRIVDAYEQEDRGVGDDSVSDILPEREKEISHESHTQTEEPSTGEGLGISGYLEKEVSSSSVHEMVSRQDSKTSGSQKNDILNSSTDKLVSKEDCIKAEPDKHVEPVVFPNLPLDIPLQVEHSDSPSGHSSETLSQSPGPGVQSHVEKLRDTSTKLPLELSGTNNSKNMGKTELPQTDVQVEPIEHLRQSNKESPGTPDSAEYSFAAKSRQAHSKAESEAVEERTIYSVSDSSTEDFYSKYTRSESRYSLSDVKETETSLEEAMDYSSVVSGGSSSVAKPERQGSEGYKNVDIQLRLADSWTEFLAPGNLQSLCLSENHIWCVDKSDRLHYSVLSGASLKWRKVDEPANQIAVSNNGWIVWRLYRGVVYAGTKITVRAPAGLKWVDTARDVLYISVDNTSAWYIKTNGEVMMQKGLCRDRPCFRSYRVPYQGKVVQIACLQGVVWAVTEDRQILVRTRVTLGEPAGQDWKLLDGYGSTLLVSSLSLGDQNTAWVVDIVGRTWFTNGVTKEKPEGDGLWWQVSMSEYLMQDSTAIDTLKSLTDIPNMLSKSLMGTGGGLITAGYKGLWMCPGCKHVVHVCRGSVLGHRWEVCVPTGMPANVKWCNIDVSAATEHHGMVWAQQTTGDIFCFPPGFKKATEVQPPAAGHVLVCVTGSEEALWALKPNGQVYIRGGMRSQCRQGINWLLLDLTQLGSARLVHICCGSQNVWAVDSTGVVYLRIGAKPPSDYHLNPAWVPVDGTTHNPGAVFTKVFVGPNDWMVWAVDNRNCVYVRKGVTDSMPIGTHWLYVSGTPAETLCVSDQMVYALNAGGELLVRYGVTQSNEAGDYWKKIPGVFSMVSVTENDDLWAIDKEGKLYQRHLHYMHRQDMLPDLMSSPSKDALEGDWELI